MRVPSLVPVCLGATLVACVVVSACSSSPASNTGSDSGDNSTLGGSSSSSSGASGSGSGGSGLSGSGSSSGSSSSSGSGGSPPSGSSSSSSGSGGSSGSSGDGGSDAAGATDGGGAVDAGLCLTGLQDKVTTCTAADPTCSKGCGPSLPMGNLGTKACSCNPTTLVYNCLSCVYAQPLPACYQPALDAGLPSPPACAPGVADRVTCATPCNGVCTIQTDAAKTDGCVCVQLSTGITQWTCQTRWW
jgi:hypothetical protein